MLVTSQGKQAETLPTAREALLKSNNFRSVMSPRNK